jgi:alpha-tubulin suppressor-like RCC1 family protein
VATAAGSYHSLFLDEDRQVWACGSCYQGQLGNGTHSVERMFPIPSKIPIPGNWKVKAIAAGDKHTVMLDENGTVWSCGDGGFGQHGQGNQKNHAVPVAILNVPPICEIYAVGPRTLLKDGNLDIWAIGSDSKGASGTLGGKWLYVPTKLNDIHGKMARFINLQYDYSITADANGNLYRFGAMTVEDSVFEEM